MLANSAGAIIAIRFLTTYNYYKFLFFISKLVGT